MDMQSVIDEIKLPITGYLLEMEIDDEVLEQVVKKCLRELQRFFDETTMITIPFASCIDLSATDAEGKNIFKERVSSIVQVYRTVGIGTVSEANVMTDPVAMQQWTIFSGAGGTMYNLNDYVMNYAAWNTLLGIKNTISTDLGWKEDRHNNKLYISNYSSAPANITIEYVPKLTSVEDIQSDYWIDVLIRLAIAETKIILGRIRTRFNQSNALWAQDGDKMLEEGNTEYKELIEVLRTNSNMQFGMD